MSALLLLCGAGRAAEVTVTVDGQSLEGGHFARDGLTYVPLVPLVRALDGAQVIWDEPQRTARAETELMDLAVPAGADYVLADGYRCALSAPSLLVDGRTYVPLRSVAALLGARVSFTGWDQPIAVTRGGARPYTEEDLYWLSRIISAESRGEDLLGQIAVGNVVLNRVDSEEFPDTIRSVVFDSKDAIQFEPVANGTVYLPPARQSQLAARLVLAGATAVEDCLYFFNPSLSPGLWIRQNCLYYTTIGCHRFYI